MEQNQNNVRFPRNRKFPGPGNYVAEGMQDVIRRTAKDEQTYSAARPPYEK